MDRRYFIKSVLAGAGGLIASRKAKPQKEKHDATHNTLISFGWNISKTVAEQNKEILKIISKQLNKTNLMTYVSGPPLTREGRTRLNPGRIIIEYYTAENSDERGKYVFSFEHQIIKKESEHENHN